MRKSTFMLLMMTSMAMAGCKGGNSADEAGALEADAVSSELQKRISHKSSVQYGSLDDLLEAQVECKGHSDQICVEICHRPPGNPENEKTRTLPISALTAHLSHGGSHHNDHDYLGPCESDTSDDDPDIVIDDPDYNGGNDETPDEEGSNDESPNDESGDDPLNDGYGTDIPTWCEPFYDVDQNCDGYNDSDFAPTF